MVTYQLSQRDFLDLHIAHRNRSVLAKWSFRLILSIAFIFLGLGLVSVAVRPNSQNLSGLVPMFAIPIMWAVLMWGSPWWAARNQFSKQSVAHGPRTMRLDSTGVHWRDEGSVFTLFVAPRASISSRNAHSHSIKWPRSEILLRKISCLARRQLTTRKSVHGPGFAGNDNSGCAPRDG